MRFGYVLYSDIKNKNRLKHIMHIKQYTDLCHTMVCIYGFSTVELELEPSSKHELCPSLSQAYFGSSTFFRARAELNSDIQLSFKPKPSLARILSLLASQARQVRTSWPAQDEASFLHFVTGEDYKDLVNIGQSRTNIFKVDNFS